MSERTTFEKFVLLCIALGSSFLLLGVGLLVGDHMARTKLEQAAATHCGAKFDELTGEFAWIECPTSTPEPEVVAPEPDPEEPAAPVEAVPPTPEKPNEPVY